MYTDNLNACKHTYKGRQISNCTVASTEFQKIWCCACLCFLLRTKSLREQWNKCEITEFAYYHTPAHKVQTSQPSVRTHMADANALQNMFAPRLHHAPALLDTHHITITIGVWSAARRCQHARAASTLAPPSPPQHGGGSNWALTSLPERGVFRKFICDHQQEKRHGMLWASPVMTVTRSGLGLLVSGSSAQLPRALNRLPESLALRMGTRKRHFVGRAYDTDHGEYKTIRKLQ